MLKYIFIGLTVVIAWVVVIVFQLPYWIAEVVTGAAILTVGIILLVRWIRARRASREIERALKAQAEEQARRARPGLEADIQSLHSEFNRAITALKGSRFGSRGASNALYSLPWYVIVGPPGVGKSTALRCSGLKFPFLSSRGGMSVQGVGGTRNCEWWMTSEAVILDTAGRYTTEENDREEWFAFLDLLRKYRSRAPINGVLATISVADIAEAHPEEVATLAREIRSRIDELQQRLGAVVPVYLLLTKLDVFPGFVETFSDLTDTDRHQIWGFTLKTSDQIDLAEQCTAHFDELVAVLEKRAMRRLAEERSGPRRGRIHEFPQYVASLRGAIGRFVHELAEANIYNETPVIRGIYLTSATQDGRPFNRIMSTVAEAFGLRPTLGATVGPPADVKSYFLGDVFRKVIFPDFGLVRLSRSRTRRTRVIGTIAGSIALVVAAVIVLFPFLAYRRNWTLLRDAGSALAYVEQHVTEDTVSAMPVDRLEPLRGVIQELNHYEVDGPPLRMRLGMYQGRRIFPRLRDVFADTVRRGLLIATMEDELLKFQQLRSRYDQSNDAPEPVEYRKSFDRLRAYLLLTGPREPTEPGATPSEQREWLANHLSQLWAPRMQTDHVTTSDVEQMARTYVDLLAEHPELVFERDQELVASVRKILSRSDRTRAIVDGLVAAAPGRPLTLRDMVGLAPMENDDRLVRAAFTRRVYDRHIKPRFDSGLEEFLDPGWVLSSEFAQQLRAEDIAAVKSEYFEQYIEEWKAFIDATHLNIPPNATALDTLSVLTDLTRGDPYKHFFERIAWETALIDWEAQAQNEDSRLSRAMRQTANQVGNQISSRALARTRLGQYGVSPQLVRILGEDAVQRVRRGRDGEGTDEMDVTFMFLPLAMFGSDMFEEETPAEGPTGPAQTLPIDEYIEQLKYVRDALEARIDDPTDRDTLPEKLKMARTKVRSLLSREADPRWSSTFDKLLLPPLEMAQKGASRDIAKERQSKWCNEVVDGFERTIANDYPFNRSGGGDVALADFETFFKPEGGQLWDYYDKVLKAAIPLQGTTFRLAPVGSSGARYQTSVVAFLNAAFEVSRTMFPRGATGPLVEFDVMIDGAPGIKEIALKIDGEAIRYRNGPQSWSEMTWPGEGTPGARIEVRGVGKEVVLEREGDWGFFRLLEKGTMQPTADKRVFVVQWDFRDEGAGLIQMKFRPKRRDTPFFGLGGRRSFMSIFRNRNLSVPRAVVQNAPPCN